MNRLLKKLNLKHEYLLLEEEDVRLELHSYVNDFESRFQKYYNKLKSDTSEDSEDYIWVNEETGETTNEPPHKKNRKHQKFKDKRLKSKSKKVDSVKMKKLFKKLASFMHPDRGGSDEEFHKLSNAYDEGDLITLLNYAKKYNIDYDMDETDSDVFKNNLDKLESEITRMKATLAWAWGVGDLKSKLDVIRTIEKQTGWKIEESDLPQELRTNKNDKKLLK